MRVLVTGGGGYIGSHACLALSEAGHEPVTFDNLSTGHRWAINWGPFEQGDIGDRARLDDVMRLWRPEAIMHFAACAYVGESMTQPDKYYRNNVAGTIALLDAARAHDVGKVVFSSTCATYGVPAEVPIPEGAPQAPINPYGRSKLMIEHLLRDYAEAFGLRSVALRYFNAAGADPKGRVGEEHDPEPHLVPLVLQAAADPSRSVTVHGDDYDTPDGTCVRDYTHVCDLADAHVLALDWLAGRPGFSAFNLGTGAGSSVRAVIERAQAITGRPIRVERGPRRPGDPPILVADPSRALASLGWRPRHADLDTMLETAWRWMAEHRRRVLAA